MVLCRETFAKDLNRSVFPEMQGGPLVHVIAAKAVCFKEAATEEFRVYIRQVVRNAKALAARIASGGFRIVSGGTDTHLMLVDVFSKGINGKQAEQALDKAGITVNKNTIPFDQNPPMTPSGIRIGTPALTTRGMKEAEMEAIGGWIAEVLEKSRGRKRAEAGEEGSRKALREVSAVLNTNRHHGQQRCASAVVVSGSFAICCASSSLTRSVATSRRCYLLTFSDSLVIGLDFVLIRRRKCHLPEPLGSCPSRPEFQDGVPAPARPRVADPGSASRVFRSRPDHR